LRLVAGCGWRINLQAPACEPVVGWRGPAFFSTVPGGKSYAALSMGRQILDRSRSREKSEKIRVWRRGCGDKYASVSV
jgi:hypothetical protein